MEVEAVEDVCVLVLLWIDDVVVEEEDVCDEDVVVVVDFDNDDVDTLAFVDDAACPVDVLVLPNHAGAAVATLGNALTAWQAVPVHRSYNCQGPGPPQNSRYFPSQRVWHG